ncbi:glycosyltransferase [Georhizobium sp. MAB10]|uniref:glycosyltransferase n=1 Tax=Georhizobium sp. MAB10 TaxID=3028319 RepID=UPI003855993B
MPELDVDKGGGAPSKRDILEIGETGLFHWAMPERTEAFYASYRADLRQGRPYLGLRDVLAIRRAMRSNRYRLVVVHPPFYSGWQPRSFLAALKFSLFRGNIRETWGALTSPLFFELLRFVALKPLIAIERSDSFGIPAHHFAWIDKADAYYKRELPVDHWQVFYGSGHRRLPGASFRRKPRWLKRLAKLKPIGLGLNRQQTQAADRAFGADKTADVFFAGGIDGNSHVRSRMPALIAALRAAGVTVDVPEGRLPLDAFMARCAKAWITLSPEGLGWDCYRHMEAAIAGSVPLVNAPTIDRYRPLEVDRHCLVYYPDEEARAVESVVAALADKPRLRDMAHAARAHALSNLTERAITEALLAEWAGGPPDELKKKEQ